MPNVFTFCQMPHSIARPLRAASLCGSRHLTTADYRRFLSEMRLRPLSERAFLRKLLQRAAANGALRVPPFPPALYLPRRSLLSAPPPRMVVNP